MGGSPQCGAHSPIPRTVWRLGGQQGKGVGGRRVPQDEPGRGVPPRGAVGSHPGGWGGGGCEGTVPGSRPKPTISPAPPSGLGPPPPSRVRGLRRGEPRRPPARRGGGGPNPTPAAPPASPSPPHPTAAGTEQPRGLGGPVPFAPSGWAAATPGFAAPLPRLPQPAAALCPPHPPSSRPRRDGRPRAPTRRRRSR